MHRLSARMDATPDFAKIVDMHYAPLYRFALSLARQQASAEDLTQHTFLQWARKGSTLRDTGKVKSWLFTTLYRHHLSRVRQERRFEIVEFNPEVHGEQVGVEAELPAVDPATLMQVLHEMEASYREPLVLFYLNELSYKEVAAVLSVPIGTVMSRLSRGKDILRLRLQKMGTRAVQASPGMMRKEVA